MNTMKKIIFVIVTILISSNFYCQTFNGSTGNIPQISGSSCDFPLTVSGINGNARLKSLKFNITHPNNYEVSVGLKGPNGEFLTIFSSASLSGSNFGNTIISYDSEQPISEGIAPYSDIFRSYFTTNFEPLNGVNLNGSWKLTVCGAYNTQNSGTLDSWSLPFFTPTELADNAATAPASISICRGQKATIYGQISKAGITEIASGASSQIQAWAGYSTSNTNPNT